MDEIIYKIEEEMMIKLNICFKEMIEKLLILIREYKINSSLNESNERVISDLISCLWEELKTLVPITYCDENVLY